MRTKDYHSAVRLLENALVRADPGAWEWNIPTGEVFFNAENTKTVSRELNDIEHQFRTWEEVIHPEDFPGVLATVRAHLNGATPAYQLEYRVRIREKQWVWLLAQGRVCERAPDGTPLRAAGTYKDITKRKEEENALRLSREIYRHAVELNLQIPWTASPDGTAIQCDPMWEAYTGMKIGKELQNGWLEAMHEDDKQRASGLWRQSAATGDAFQMLSRFRYFDGAYRQCESKARPERNAEGEIVRWYGTTQDIHERQVAGERLRTEESRLALALDGGEVATWDWNLRTGEVLRDERWFQMLGFPEEEAKARAGRWAQRVYPEDRRMLEGLWDAHCNDESRPFRAEYRIRHQSGEWRWVLAHGRVVERDEKGPVRACGINQDITERRRFEDALAGNERFNDYMLEAYQDCAALLDEEGCILYLNPAAIRNLGLAGMEEARGRSWIELWRKQDQPGIRKGIQSAFAGACTAVQAFCAARETRNTWWDVLLSPLAIGAGQPKRVLAVAREVTRLREDEIRREAMEQERLQAILENLNEGIVIVTPDGRVLMMNEAAREMYGLPDAPAAQGAIRSKDLSELVDVVESIIPDEERPLMRAIRGEAFSGMEITLRNRRDGRQWIANCGSTPIRSPAAELLLGVLIVRDVTAERSAHDEIRRANEELHDLSGQLLQLQDEERKRIARELHDGTVQGLAATMLNLTILANSAAIRGLDGERRLVHKTIELAEQCIQELRAMSYLMHPPGLDELGLAPALGSWIDGFSERTGIEVDIVLPIPMVRLRPEVESALFRITQEALGNVHRHAHCKKARVLLTIGSEEIALEVMDDGVGFGGSLPGQDGYTPKSGVGLPGIRERANQLGGAMKVTSVPGKTVVHVTLPGRACHL